MAPWGRPPRDELHAIERLANQVVLEGRKVSRTWHKREEAESRWGLQLLQGGIPKGREVRVVMVHGVATPPPQLGGNPQDDKDFFDVEYCGGTHCDTTAEVGPVKLYRTERVQDGVERFEYSAGPYSVGKWQESDDLLARAGAEMDVSPSEVPNASKRFFTEWKDQRKQLESLHARLAELEGKQAHEDAVQVGAFRLVAKVLPSASLQKVASELTQQQGMVALLVSAEGPFIFARSSDVPVDLRAKFLEVKDVAGARGGGKPDLVQGAATNTAQIGAFLDQATRNIAQVLVNT